jgi:hypothetical protein
VVFLDFSDTYLICCYGSMSDTLLEPEANSDELTASQRPSSCADPEGSDDHEESIILRGKVKQVLVEEDEAFLSELGSLISKIMELFTNADLF